MNKFGEFLINEEKNYFGGRLSDVLTSLQDIQNDMDNLGTRHLSRLAENIVNQIRKILHSHWNPKYNNKLKELQKIAVAIQKTIDERGDLKQVLPASVSALEELSGKLGVKVNSLKAPESQGEEDIQPQDFKSTQEQNPAPFDSANAQLGDNNFI
jgi:hypothetical protein